MDIPLTQGQTAIIDDTDRDAVQGLKWTAVRDHKTWYALTWVRQPGGAWKRLRLHTLLTGWTQVDHRNGNGLDNRRANLRQVTVTQNAFNRRKGKGTSRFKGVSWRQREDRWMAEIETGQLRRYLGRFDDEAEAARAYDAAARELFGEFAALNFPRPGERSALAETPG